VKRKWRLTYPVLVDTDNSYAKQLGIAFELPEDLRTVYAGFGVDLPTAHAGEAWELPLPTRLVVAADGTIASIDADPDYTVRPEAQASLEALRSIG
jgi:peroxiredoxin